VNINISHSFRMHPTTRLLAARVHQPLIRFGRRSQPSGKFITSMRTGFSLCMPVARAHAHPFAPPKSRESFDDFVRSQSTQLAVDSSTSPDVVPPDERKKVYHDFWEAPERYWKHELEDYEIHAIQVSKPSFFLSVMHQRVPQSGGASLR
jgi:small subunit ribosomal protein YMR-31